MSEQPRNPLALVVGTLLIAVGVLTALDRTGVLIWSHQRNLWPLVLIAIGLAQLTYTYDARPRRGLAFILLGGWLLLYELGVMALDKSWPLVVVAIGVAIAWDGWSPGRELSQEERALRDRRRGELKPLMMIGIIVAAVLVGQEGRVIVQANTTADHPQVMAVMGGNQQVVYARPFRSAEMTAFMGGASLDLRNTTIEPGEEASIDVFTMMGGSVLYVPRDWIVDTKALAVMGGIDDRRFARTRDDARGRRDRSTMTAERPADERSPAESLAPPSADAPSSTPPPRLVIRGMITMGALVIKP